MAVLNGNTATMPSTWVPAAHPSVDSISDQVDGWFLQHWPFLGLKARKKFVAAGFSRVTCLYFPLARDDRIAFACKLLTILFLIDDILEDMSFDDGKAYNERLMPIARGDVKPDPSIPVEWMFDDIWAGMRAQDIALANNVLEPCFVFMRAQTDKSRKSINEFGDYMNYRERDVGSALLYSLMRFAMGLHLEPEKLAPEELQTMKQVEQNCAKHLAIVNDIYSWEKELAQSEKSVQEGSVLCSAVKVMADNAGLSVDAAKRVLWSMVREWENKHEMLCAKSYVQDPDDPKSLYLQGLKYQMCGNELWSRTTPRYLVVD
ncbi:Aristolochene synthase [Venustampulla echinocandica]|uniref:Terpene synthase n=1 Tax=Venustampulla echinocandica TaxID=2656787 RepID=A0A370TX81_9HELO|nr:Aristolochene synthase [Venustampulla echinocandica]RDL40131.1 Aristolochene synthase [Venustampulla echinocandica]